MYLVEDIYKLLKIQPVKKTLVNFHCGLLIPVEAAAEAELQKNERKQKCIALKTCLVFL
jgi:hypothetical protein